MSTRNARDRSSGLTADGTVLPSVFRLLALGCVLILTASYVSVLGEVTSVVGGTEPLLATVGVMLVAATVLAGTIRPRTAAIGTIVLFLAGFGYYFSAAGVGVGVALGAMDEVIADTVTLITGLPLLRMVRADVWALGFAPGPVFLSWYLAVRDRYDLAVVPGGFALLFLVLTGDATPGVTLLGTLGAVGAIGFGELDRRGGSVALVDLLAVLVSVIVVLSMSVTVVPGGPASPEFLNQGEPGSLEGAIDSASDRSGIAGTVDLSPEVRFTVQSEQPSYWRTGVYDRYTGNEWIRTGQERQYDGAIDPPPGKYETTRHVVTAETKLGVMPVAPQPLAVEGDLTEHTTVSSHGQPRPTTPLLEGDKYIVESAIVDPNPEDLRTAGTNYPDDVTQFYLQTPEGTSEAFEERTAEVTADADTAYDKAAAIESHLRTSKDYSLEVDRPADDVAETFLLEMDEGYCVYFATTMVQMLRTEGVPARYVTGYTTGQQVDDDTYVVRGLDAHAWVEVYFPGHGWVAFEPTPGGERDAVHDERIREARQNGADNVDTDASSDVPIGDEDSDDNGSSDPPSGSDDPNRPNESPPDDGRNGSNSSDGGAVDPPSGDSGVGSEAADGGTDDGAAGIDRLTAPITRETAGIALVVLVGLVAGARRTDAVTRARREFRVYWHGPREDPDADARRAYRRLERHLARQYRPRRDAESPRRYLAALRDDHAIDPRVETVVATYEHATYGTGVDRDAAETAIEIVDGLVRTHLPLGE
ncbi:transglutaminase TgpA family protein [Halosolutus gelatinilyticus]|uniref:transglutaminase TgpA family protein n=1 Tax=Halosolutus gelatinilyticus TaxID=2931975 RepID=UPI001FF3EF9D|nr:DUF3488 and transglutaminase-like domain-containing protein [Halosolutus gelatinilyticus]